MHDDLKTPELALERLAHDVLIHLVRQSGRLWQVRVAVPATWDAASFAAGMRAKLAERGHPDVEVTMLVTSGEPRLRSVLIG